MGAGDLKTSDRGGPSLMRQPCQRSSVGFAEFFIPVGCAGLQQDVRSTLQRV